MRTEQEMFDLILAVGKRDERIVAIYMNGSRTNVNADQDIFQDYDIVYVVQETASFIEDKEWIKQFGDILYMQYPDESPYGVSDKENFYGWLMQFKDGNRLDLHVESITHALKFIEEDRLCKILLDKKGILPDMGKATDEQYWVKRPSQEEFLACCNEFWWCTNNLAKGLWREEISYLQDMTNFVVRKQLEKMLAWQIGVLTGFSVSIGKSGKYMNRWLSKEVYERYLNTYFGGKIQEAWQAIKGMCELFDETARKVAEQLAYTYNQEEADAASVFLEHVRMLPKDAKEIYK